MSTQTSFAWCSNCGYIGPDFKTKEYLPYVDEGRKMSGGKNYECPKCGLSTGEQVIQEHFESLESRLAEAQGDHDIAEKLRLAKENLGIGICFMGDLDERAKSEAILEFVNSILESKVESLDEDRKKEIERMMKYGPDKVDPEPFGFGG